MGPGGQPLVNPAENRPAESAAQPFLMRRDPGHSAHPPFWSQRDHRILVITTRISGMAREASEWNELQRQGSTRGGHAYIPLEELEELNKKTGLDLDEPIEYSVTIGVSDGRARAFIGLRNVEE